MIDEPDFLSPWAAIDSAFHLAYELHSHEIMPCWYTPARIAPAMIEQPILKPTEKGASVRFSSVIQVISTFEQPSSDFVVTTSFSDVHTWIQFLQQPIMLADVEQLFDVHEDASDYGSPSCSKQFCIRSADAQHAVLVDMPRTNFIPHVTCSCISSVLEACYSTHVLPAWDVARNSLSALSNMTPMLHLEFASRFRLLG